MLLGGEEGLSELNVGCAYIVVNGTYISFVCHVNLGDGACDGPKSVIMAECRCCLMVSRMSCRGAVVYICRWASYVSLKCALKLFHVLLASLGSFHATTAVIKSPAVFTLSSALPSSCVCVYDTSAITDCTNRYTCSKADSNTDHFLKIGSPQFYLKMGPRTLP